MDEAIEAIKLNTRHYAKRQLTWFRRDARVQWIRASEHTADEIVEKVKRKYPEGIYYGGDLL